MGGVIVVVSAPVETTIKPQPGPQTMFLSSPADIAIMGGAAGGGKTYAEMLEPTRHIDNPKFGCVIFRRTLPSIKIEGGMWDESDNIYYGLAGEKRQGDLSWKFPSGAKITFAGIQYDSDLIKYRGAQIALMEFDQLEEFNQYMFFYMLSRNRSVSGVRPYVRASANPEPGWLADFLDWWIADDGYADLEKAGRLRWFIRRGEEIVWASRPEILRRKYKVDPKSVTFIPASIYDNPILLEADPGYLANLQSLPLVERARLLGDPKRGGNWKIKPTAGNVYNRGWYEIVPQAPFGGVECLYWDFAATEKKKKGKSPSYTAGVAVRKVDDNYYVRFVVAEQIGPAAVDRLFVNTSRQLANEAALTRTAFRIRWEIEPGSAGIRESRRLVKLLDGLDAKGARIQGDKMLRGRGFASQSEHKYVKVVEADWNERWLNHMHNQPDIDENDIHDGTVGAYNELSDGKKTAGSARSK